MESFTKYNAPLIIGQQQLESQEQETQKSLSKGMTDVVKKELI
jgi:hypothetical protein